MTAHDMITGRLTTGRRQTAARLSLAALAGLVLLGLQACATTDVPQPKYPVYMQDKPAEATQAVSDVEAPDVAAAPMVTPPVSNGGITTTELAPPPPPPPPPPGETVTLAATPAKSTTPVAPVKDTRAAFVYILSAHDTLYGVSRRFGVPIKTLYDINGLEATATLRIGQKILLPDSAVDKGVEEHANGAGMVRLTTALAANTGPAPLAAKPATAPVVVKQATSPTPAKPVIAAPPAKPPVTTTTTTTTTTVAAAPVVKPAAAVPIKPSAPAATPAQSKPATKPAAIVTPAGFPSNSQISQMGKGQFAWPVKGKVIVPFGQLAPNVRNDGINIAATSGTEVRAAADGVVVYEGDQVKELGNTVYIKHPNGWYTGYSHLSDMNVSNNEAVKKGQVIGTVGQSGTIDQPQLHFEVRYTPSTDIARPIDPDLVLP